MQYTYKSYALIFYIMYVHWIFNVSEYGVCLCMHSYTKALGLL